MSWAAPTRSSGRPVSPAPQLVPRSPGPNLPHFFPAQPSPATAMVLSGLMCVVSSHRRPGNSRGLLRFVQHRKMALAVTRPWLVDREAMMGPWAQLLLLALLAAFASASKRHPRRRRLLIRQCPRLRLGCSRHVERRKQKFK
ncbi:hypothetical protein B0H67DRAFT_317471 [Lasiosphaeris hirsuta]|uniref:Uncharacterized protein n=1 Tax=Lasiosphaeris hirsuta TaxID=260670 RepID=A0AA40A1I8_9PEZI|nr:hypothetical protein B0H67DRAFT_317471 [Lasiosphaeris hirsuta]